MPGQASEEGRWGTERSHSVPYAKEVDPDFVRHQVGDVAMLLLEIVPLAVAIGAKRLGEQMHRGFLDEAGLLDEAGQRPHRVGATAKAEEEDVIAGKIVVDQKLIGLLDIPGEAPAARAAEEAIDDVVGADAGYVLDDLTFRWRWLGDDRPAEFQDIRGSVLPGIVDLGRIPGAVATDY